jgi:hypothetical protein
MKVMSFPFRVTLSLFRAMLASWRKKLGLLGPQEHTTCATTTSQKPSQALDDVMSVLGDVMGLQGQCRGGKCITPLGTGSLRCLWWNVLLFFDANPMICLFPLLGSQHPSDGISAPWRSELIISPCVPIHKGTIPSSMVLHISRYPLHGLISHRDHRNVNHI